MTRMNNGEFQAHTQRVDELVQRVNALPDEHARATALELLQSLMDLHGAVIARVVEVLSESGESGRSALSKLGSDPLVCGLLVLYGIHPLTIEERVKRAIEQVQRQLHKPNGSVELLSITDAAVRIKIHGDANGASAEKLKLAVEQAILEIAPEVVEIVCEGLPPSGFVPLNMIQPAIKEEKNYEESPA